MVRKALEPTSPKQVVFLLTLALLINYIDRGNLATGLDPLFWAPQCLQRRSQQWRTKERSIQRSFAGRWSNWSGRAANTGTCPGSLVQRIGRSENGSSKPSEMLSVAMAV